MIKKVAREARKLRMLQREMEKEDTKSSRKRKEAKHNYAAKVLNTNTISNTKKSIIRCWATWAHWGR